jgi:hypothetical protein
MHYAPAYRAEPSTPSNGRAPITDATVCIRDWSRCGTFLGANVGIVLGAIFVAIPFTSEIPTLGLFRTLLIGVIACAVMAGGFAALAATLYGKSRGRALSFAPAPTQRDRAA